MTAGDAYRAKAAEFVGKAARENDGHTRANLYTLAQSYLRLAEQADRNALTDVILRTPASRPATQQPQQQQQQQQIQPKTDET